jgi:hypothetical protein
MQLKVRLKPRAFALSSDDARREKQKASRVMDRRGFGVWWRFRDSNPGPADYDSVALTD